MKILKPSFVNHEGSTLYAIDVHPIETKFITAGMGVNSGRMIIWSTNSLRVSETSNSLKNSNEQIICKIDDHSGCINCVRWSPDGKLIASGACDNLVIIWHKAELVSHGENKLKKEWWKRMVVLHGHEGDVLDLQWSKNQRFLASGGVDTKIILWDALDFPQRLATLTGHSGFIKGLAFDPVSEFIASQSDDKTVKIWSLSRFTEKDHPPSRIKQTKDIMSIESVVTIRKPFEKCSSVTQVLRLDWSPLGNFFVTAHALNGTAPVAKLVERNTWNFDLDCVGHRKAITSVKFSPTVYRKYIENQESESRVLCAIGSRDSTLSIWIFPECRPLIVIHELSNSSVIDMSWSHDGSFLIVASWDGSISYIDLQDEIKNEIFGSPLTELQKSEMISESLGVSLNVLKPVLNYNSTKVNIIEDPLILEYVKNGNDATVKVNLENREDSNLKNVNLSSPIVTSSIQSKDFITDPISQNTESLCNKINSSTDPSTSSTSQIQKISIGKDGKRRITPITIMAPIDSLDPPISDSLGHEITSNDPYISSQDTPQCSQVDQTTDIPFMHVTTPTKHDSESALLSQFSSILSPSTSKNKKRKTILESEDVSSKSSGKRQKLNKATTDKGDDKYHGQKQEDNKLVGESITSGSTLETRDTKPSVKPTINLNVRDKNGIIFNITANNKQGKQNSSHLTVYAESTSEKSSLQFWESTFSGCIYKIYANEEILIVCTDKSNSSCIPLLHVFSLVGLRLLPMISVDSNSFIVGIDSYNSEFFSTLSSRDVLRVWSLKQRRCVIRSNIKMLLGTGGSSGLNISSHTLSVFTDSSGNYSAIPIICLSNFHSFLYDIDLDNWILMWDSSFSSLASNMSHQTPSFESNPSSHPTLSSCNLYKLFVNFARKCSGGSILTNKTLESFGNVTNSTPNTIDLFQILSQNAISLRSFDQFYYFLIALAEQLVLTEDVNMLRELCNILVTKNDDRHSLLGLKTFLVKDYEKLLPNILHKIAKNLNLQKLFQEFHLLSGLHQNKDYEGSMHAEIFTDCFLSSQESSKAFPNIQTET